MGAWWGRAAALFSCSWKLISLLIQKKASLGSGSSVLTPNLGGGAFSGSTSEDQAITKARPVLDGMTGKVSKLMYGVWEVWRVLATCSLRGERNRLFAPALSLSSL